jgi:hypothetical protein
MKEIFQDIQNILTAQVPEIVWIDMNEGQFEAFGEDAPVDYPCVLVNFPQATFTNQGRRGQLAEVTITIRIAFKLWEKFNTKVPNREIAFQHFTIVKKVMRAIHGLSGTNYTPLIRTDFVKTNEIDPKIYDVTYKCSMSDWDIIQELETTTIDELTVENNS